MSAGEIMDALVTAGQIEYLVTRRNRRTGTTVHLIREAGQYWTTCEDHGGAVSHETQPVARQWLSHPDEWCDGCMAAGPAKPKAVEVPRYRVEKQEWTPNWDCWHPLCETLHKRWRKFDSERGRTVCFKPVAPQVEWIIIDTETGDRADEGALSESFELRRDAVRCLESFLSWKARQQ